MSDILTGSCIKIDFKINREIVNALDGIHSNKTWKRNILVCQLELTLFYEYIKKIVISPIKIVMFILWIKGIIAFFWAFHLKIYFLIRKNVSGN